MDNMIIETPEWSEYQLLDSGNCMRLERFGTYTLARPDPQALWKPRLSKTIWESADATFELSTEKGEPRLNRGERGKWKLRTQLPEKWLVHYGEVAAWVKLTPFKHTGVFPEQSAQWEWMDKKLKNQNAKFKSENKQLHVLNLFAYTGIASLVCANAGAKVTHVDASKPSISWARENQVASLLEDKPIRWILDDAVKFVQREIKRGVRYDGIIMDPPVYGHGPEGERWEFSESFPYLLDLCKQVLSSDPVFLMVNAYAISASSLMLENMLGDLQLPGVIESGELALRETETSRLLSTGIFARWASR